MCCLLVNLIEPSYHGISRPKWSIDYFNRARAGANLEGMLLCLHLMLLGYVSSSGLLGRSMGCAPFSVLAVQVTESET